MKRSHFKLVFGLKLLNFKAKMVDSGNILLYSKPQLRLARDFFVHVTVLPMDGPDRSCPELGTINQT